MNYLNRDTPVSSKVFDPPSHSDCITGIEKSKKNAMASQLPKTTTSQGTAGKASSSLSQVFFDSVAQKTSYLQEKGKDITSILFGGIQLAFRNAINKPNLKDQQKTQLSPFELKEILCSLTTNHSKMDEMHQKYGDKMFDQKFLLSQINLISNKKQRDYLLNKFFQNSLNSAGHDFSLGGSINIKNMSNFDNAYFNKSNLKFLASLQKNLGELRTAFIMLIDGDFGGLKKLFMGKDVPLSQEPSNQVSVNLETSRTKIGMSKLYFSISSFLENPTLSTKRAHIEEVQQSVKNGLDYTFGNSESYNNIDFKDIEARIKNGELVTIGTGWLGHGVSISIKGDMIAYSNRGGSEINRNREDYGIRIYKMTKKENLDADLLKKILNLSDPAKSDRVIFLEGKKEDIDSKGGHSLNEILGFEEVTKITKQPQKVANCTWAAAKCSFEAGLILLDLAEYRSNNNDSLPPKADLGVILNEAKAVYRAFDLNHRVIELKATLDLFEANPQQLSPHEELKFYSQLESRLEFSLNVSKRYPIEKEAIAKNLEIVRKRKEAKIEELKEMQLADTLKFNDGAEIQKIIAKPGDFTIAETNNHELELHFCVNSSPYRGLVTINGPVGTNEVQKLKLIADKDDDGAFYRLENNNQIFRTLGEIGKFVEENSLRQRNTYPNDFKIRSNPLFGKIDLFAVRVPKPEFNS